MLLLTFFARARGFALPSELSIRAMLEASPLAAFSEELAKLDLGLSAKVYNGQSVDESGRYFVYLQYLSIGDLKYFEI